MTSTGPQDPEAEQGCWSYQSEGKKKGTGVSRGIFGGDTEFVDCQLSFLFPSSEEGVWLVLLLPKKIAKVELLFPHPLQHIEEGQLS